MTTLETIVPQNQAWPNRAPVMAELFRQFFAGKPINAIEIGVWYGIGSTNIWLEHLAKGSKLFLIDSWAPYASEDDLNDPGWDYRCMDELSTDAFMSAFLNVRRFEKSTRQHEVAISLMRGNSCNILSSMANDYFDFIYIDGDHKYANIKKDLVQAKRLIKKDFGIICGDDLEHLPTQELYEFSKGFSNRDYLREPHNFHPGVLMAVHEEFSQVNMLNGFWWVACVNSEFTGMDLECNVADLLNPVQRQQSYSEDDKDAHITELTNAISERDRKLNMFNQELLRAEAQLDLIKEIWFEDEPL